MYFELGPITHNKVQGKQQTETNQSQDQQHRNNQTEVNRQQTHHKNQDQGARRKEREAHKTANNRYRTYLKRPRVNPGLGKAWFRILGQPPPLLYSAPTNLNKGTVHWEGRRPQSKQKVEGRGKTPQTVMETVMRGQQREGWWRVGKGRTIGEQYSMKWQNYLMPGTSISPGNRPVTRLGPFQKEVVHQDVQSKTTVH